MPCCVMLCCEECPAGHSSLELHWDDTTSSATQLRHMSKQPHWNCFQQIPTSLRSQPFRYRQGTYCAPYLRYKRHSWKKCCLLWLWRVSQKLNVWGNTLCNILHFLFYKDLHFGELVREFRIVRYYMQQPITERIAVMQFVIGKKLRCELNTLLLLLTFNNFIDNLSRARLWYFIIQFNIFLGSIIQQEIFW